MTQTQAARHSKNQDTAATRLIETSKRARAAPRSPCVRAPASRSGRAGASGRAARPRLRARACTTTSARLPAAPRPTSRVSERRCPRASVTRSASTIGADRATGTPYERRRSPDFSNSPSFAGVIVTVSPARKIVKLRPRGHLDPEPVEVDLPSAEPDEVVERRQREREREPAPSGSAPSASIERVEAPRTARGRAATRPRAPRRGRQRRERVQAQLRRRISAEVSAQSATVRRGSAGRRAAPAPAPRPTSSRWISSR